jgi:hypothetical protein
MEAAQSYLLISVRMLIVESSLFINASFNLLQIFILIFDRVAFTAAISSCRFLFSFFCRLHSAVFSFFSFVSFYIVSR